jgi:hypothetical protein
LARLVAPARGKGKPWVNTQAILAKLDGKLQKAMG